MSQQEQVPQKVRDFYAVVKPDHPKEHVEDMVKYVLSVGEEKANVKFREKYGVDLGDYRGATLEKRVYKFLARVDPVNTDEVKKYLVGDEDAVNAVLRKNFGEDLTSTGAASPSLPVAQTVYGAPQQQPNMDSNTAAMLQLMKQQQRQLEMMQQQLMDQSSKEKKSAANAQRQKKQKEADDGCACIALCAYQTVCLVTMWPILCFFMGEKERDEWLCCDKR